MRELYPRRVQYVLEIIFSAAVPLIDDHHFKGLIRRIKEYSRKNDFNPLLTSRDFDTVSWRKFNHCGSMVYLSCMHCRQSRARSRPAAGTVLEHRFS
jgi:hypothetical protein